MKFIRLILIQVVFIFAAASCTNSTRKLDTTVPDYEAINEERLDSAFRQMLDLLPDSATAELPWAKLHYSINNFTPEWVFPVSNSEKIDTLLTYLSKSEEHGISVEQFDLDTLIILNEQLKEKTLSYSGMAFLEIKASTAFLRYCKALSFGLFKPKEISPNYHFTTLSIDTTFTLNSFKHKNSNLNLFLTQVQPRDENYLKLQSARKSYLQFIDSVFTPIPILNKKETIKFGTAHSSIPLIARRLMISGELDNNYQSDHQAFDKELLLALNKFRTKTGLYIDNEIGNNTIRLLNFTFKDYVDKIDVNLERLRWQPTKPLGKKYIRVNVADMTLKAFRNDTLALKMKVCVGKAPKNKTPFLRSNIYEVILNPTWGIPNSIVIKETAIAAAKDTSYLRRHKIRVFRRGVEIHPDKEEWSKVNKNYQPFTLVQDSGDINALGRIKFNFPNKFSVYLHDTNSKGAFNRHNRAVSHGCVRVEKPLDLSYFCLPEFNTANEIKIEERAFLQDKIRRSIHLQPLSLKGIETLATSAEKMQLRKVSLYPNIPIMIDYFTCFPLGNGKVVFRDDIYELDRYVIENLRKHVSITVEGLPEK